MSPRTTLPVGFYIPVKDGEWCIGACLESVLTQSCPPEQIIVYYNVSSTDRTRAIVAQYPVTVQDVTVPLSDTRNLALQELAQEWIACCDADVVLAPDWLARLWEHRHRGCIISGNTRERIRTPGDRFRSITSPHNWGAYDVDNPYMLVPDMLAHRTTLQRAGQYRTGWVNYEDSEMSRRLKERGERFYYVAGAHAEHWRQDTPFSCLDLRWRHSLQRQAHLFADRSGRQQRVRNSIALATVIASRALVEHAPEVVALATLLPLHHLLRDMHYAGESSRCESGVAVGQCPALELFADVLRPIWPEGFAELWHAHASAATDTALLGFFADHYTRFLQALGESAQPLAPLIRPLPMPPDRENPWAIDDATWAQMVDQTCAAARTRSGSALGPQIALHAGDDATLIASCQTGCLSFRQRLYPLPPQVWTCRALTELLAQHHKHLLWTETFQGSSVMAFAAA